MVENRLVGMKSRGVYETPGGAILYKAHNVLETITLTKRLSTYKEQHCPARFGELVYNGQWFTPLREALSAFVDRPAENGYRRCYAEAVQGQHDQRRRHLARTPCTTRQIATFGEDDDYNQADCARASSTCLACPLQSVPSWPRTGPLRTNSQTL